MSYCSRSRRRRFTVLDFKSWAFTAFQQHLYCACAETAIYELGGIVVPNLVKIDAVVSIIWHFQYFAPLAWKHLFTPLKLGFWGDFTHKMWSNMNETPKMHIRARDRVVWAIKRENPSTGLTCRQVPEKSINKYISPICPEGPRGRIFQQIWHSR